MFKDVLQDNAGGASSIRLMMLAWGLIPLVVWAGISVYKMNPIELPSSVLTIIGIFAGSKVVQRFGEKETLPQPG